ncbi:MAG TPA: helix-turn-helix transcriptional regulator [Nevskiaceae bacterium]|nr:helix-turn-helix transcriptional regulator [Nevskiaceae bacterium]
MAAQLVALRRAVEDFPLAARAPAQPWLPDLLGLIYDAPGAEQPWARALESVKARLDAEHAVFMLRVPTAVSGGVFVSGGAEIVNARDDYQREFFADDPFVGLSDGDVVSADELLGPRWLLSPIYKNYFAPLGMRHLLAADIRTPDGAHCSLRLVRGAQAPEFSTQDKALVRTLVPHIRRAISLWSRIESLECDRQVFAGTVSRLSLGIVSFGPNGELVHVNDEARRLLDEQDGISQRGGALWLDSPTERREFQRLVHEAIERTVSGQTETAVGLAEAMAVIRPSGKAPLAIMIKPAPPAPGVHHSRRAYAVVYLRDPVGGTVPKADELIRRIFGLTRVEARLTVLLCEGYSLDETAEILGVRRNTARTHLRAVFAKTGVSRQTLLVRMMLRGVMSLG